MANLSKPNHNIVDDTNIATPTYFYEVTIADGDDTSDGFFMPGDNIIGIITPATLEATSITFEVSLDGVAWVALSGVSITVTTSTAYELTAQTVYGWPFVRLVGNSAASGADRIIKVLIKRI